MTGTNSTPFIRIVLIGCTLLLLSTMRSVAIADTADADTAKLAQNPIASVISVPLQNNTNLNVGPEAGALNVLNVQPVVPLKAPGNQQWTVPLGGGFGKIVHWGRVPVNLQLASYYNVASPAEGPNWQIRTQLQLLFPK